MKKYVIGLLLCIASSLFAEPQEVFSRSFMYTRPAWFNIAMDQQLWHNFVYAKDGPGYGGFQFISYYQKSRPRAKNARYFLINRKNVLLISGDNNTNLLFERDIRAEWVNLPTDFKGKMSLCPEQRQMGFKLMYSQDLKKFTDFWFMKDWTLGFELPVNLVENNINFCQFDMSSIGTQIGTQPDIFSAFNQCDWKYAKIPTRKKNRFRPAELKVTLGRAFPLEDYFQLDSFMGLAIPLADHQDAEFLFSPYVGNNRHVGLSGTVLMQLLLNRHSERFAWLFFIDLEGIFYVRNKQHRTYDLKNKPWSRYMQYVRRGDPPGQTIPGVNLLTFPSLVRPFGTSDFSFGWRIITGAFEFEVGYDLWGHGDERVKLRSPVNTPFNRKCGGLNDFGIAGAGTIIEKGQVVAATASKSTIACQTADDDKFTGICENDIDLCSAAASSALNHKIHVACGIEHIGDNMNGFAGFGFFFEFPQKNSPLANWGTWFKVGGTF